MSEQVYYSKGFKKSISDTHAWRTVANSSEFVVKVLKPNFKVLDAGCGPGSITIDFAANYLPQGSIVGIEPTQELIDTANVNKEKYGKPLDNLSFIKGSIYELPFKDNTFDLVHVQQVIIHLQDPIRALKELKRVVKPNGFVCVRDADLSSFLAYPEEYSLLGEHYALKAKNAVSTDIKAGRKLRPKALQAGYESDKIRTSVSNWICTDSIDAKHRWAAATVARLESGGEKFYPEDDAKDKELREKVIELWKKWSEDETSMINLPNYEIIYQK
ncbi:uncharacterized protein SPAPADRAFT_59610 [Spathaspora passalidarum NRRL Y-27907]|uniref:Methyltransferase domain-containing protein n=1 Tax=Spathaspora passalidarum (strain NRRL Y-27907 / 11-Y1) TaxID=619300 RepID=G3AHL0_SPAPN|nr:uncharacterized protein SPAPADRAFT_59610 [Spathaspora passalidarum NRRL Y-27907]EGW34174.1 hypothetical protein SPAPADRAFT_59610 [Spathaspora passalidarum NRRL Y-27907]